MADWSRVGADLFWLADQIRRQRSAAMNMQALQPLYAFAVADFALGRRMGLCLRLIVGLKALLSCYWLIHARQTRLILPGLGLMLDLFHPRLPLHRHRRPRLHRLPCPGILPRLFLAVVVVEGRGWKKLWVLKR